MATFASDLIKQLVQEQAAALLGEDAKRSHVAPDAAPLIAEYLRIMAAEAVHRAVDVHNKRPHTPGSCAAARPRTTRDGVHNPGDTREDVDTHARGSAADPVQGALHAAAAPAARVHSAPTHESTRTSCVLTSGDLREVLPQLLLDFA